MIGVQLDGPRFSLSGKEVFRHRTNPKEDWSQKLLGLAADLDTTLRKGPPNALVVRRIDWTQFRKENVTRARYEIDGTILSTARRHVEIVDSKSGGELGKLCDSDKESLEHEAAQLLGDELKQAVAAGIGALVLVGQA